MHKPVSSIQGCTSEFLGLVTISVNGKAGTPSFLFGCMEDHKGHVESRIGLHAISFGTAGGGIRGCFGNFLENAATNGRKIPQVHLRILSRFVDRVRKKVAEGCPEHLLANITVDVHRSSIAKQAIATAG